MLNLKSVCLSSRSYYIIFFKVIFLHFKFVVFFTFFLLPLNFFVKYRTLFFSYYCGLSLVSSKVVYSIFVSSFNLNLFWSRVGVLYSNYVVILFDLMFYLLDKYNSITFLSFFFGSNFVNFFDYSLAHMSKLFLFNSRFRFFFQPLLYILFLYRLKCF